MDEEQAFWTWYGEFLDEDMESARKIGKYHTQYHGNAVILPDDDPLSVEWSMYHDLYA